MATGPATRQAFGAARGAVHGVVRGVANVVADEPVRSAARGPVRDAARGVVHDVTDWSRCVLLCGLVWAAPGCSGPAIDPANPSTGAIAAAGLASPPSSGPPPSFTVRGQWPDPAELTYRIEIAGGPVDDARFRAAVEDAVARWQAAGPVAFRAAAAGEPAHVVIGWRRGAHDGCRPFGSSTEVAHTGPVSEGTFVHLDAARDWSEDGGALPRAVCHELGHVLGLGHSRDPDALMALDPEVDGPGSSDRAGLHSLYGGGASLPGDLRVVRASGEGVWRDVAPALRGVAPATDADWAVFDTDGDGDDEVLVWRTDPGGAGALVIHHFAPGQGDGPALVRTTGPLLGAVPVGSTTRFHRAEDGSRWIASVLMDGSGRLRRFDGSGLLVRPTAEDDPWSGGRADAFAGEAASGQRPARVVEGDLDGDGVRESVLAGD
jgi:hypothetical protein